MLVAAPPVALAKPTPDDRLTQTVDVEPVVLCPAKVAIEGSRTGQSLYVRVVGTVSDYPASTDFEHADDWQLRASTGGIELARLVMGSSRVVRQQKRRGLWDVTITFDTAFRLPTRATSSEVWVAPPCGDFERFVVAGL